MIPDHYGLAGQLASPYGWLIGLLTRHRY
jgi:hypothetical protein